MHVNRAMHVSKTARLPGQDWCIHIDIDNEIDKDIEIEIETAKRRHTCFTRRAAAFAESGAPGAVERVFAGLARHAQSCTRAAASGAVVASITRLTRLACLHAALVLIESSLAPLCAVRQ